MVGKLGNLKAFIKYLFNVDYSDMIRSFYLNKNSNSAINNRQRNSHFRTIHEELVSNLVIFIRQVAQDSILMIRILKNCWFFLEITIKSICIYYTTYRQIATSDCNDTTKLLPSSKLFDDDFYASLRSLYELLIDYLIKCVSNIKGHEIELLNACKSSNRSLAMFIKVTLKFIFYLLQNLKCLFLFLEIIEYFK